MPRSAEQKIKLLVLYDLLQKETDEEHALSTDEIIEKLYEKGIEVARKVLPGDIALLNKYGFEILSYKKRSYYYYVSFRRFDIAEIRVLMDAVQAANFISETRTVSFVERLAAMTGDRKAELLKRNFVCYGTVKKDNKFVFYSINEIEKAIETGYKISFKYISFDYKGNKNYRREGRRYIVNPIMLVYSHDNYYLICYDDKHRKQANYRIDRIEDLKIEEDKKITEYNEIKPFDINAYRKQVFSMFCGELTKVQLTLQKDLIEEIFDRFGLETEILPVMDGWYKANVNVQVSPTFFRWVVGSLGKIKIDSPKEVKEEFQAFVQQIKENY